MKKKKFKTMKVFDCQDMPQELCSRFLREMYDPPKGNDVAIDWPIHFSIAGEHQLSDEIDEWLISCGAKSGEVVIIKHWW